MTAFARVSMTVPQGSFAWEIKSVNNKAFDIRLRLPPGFDAADAECRGLIAAAIARGSVQATLTLQRPRKAPMVRIDSALLRALIDAVVEAMPEGAPVAPPTMDGLLAVRGVLDVVEAADLPADQASLATVALDCLTATLRDVKIARDTEGAALGRLLSDHLGAIVALTAAAEQAPGRRPAAILARLVRSIETLTSASPALDPERLHQEAILLATRADVREEIDRLAIHARAAADLLQAGGPVGRRLDFLAQELSREASTLCAKSNDAALTAIGLDLRTRIEQFREQVQNLE